MLAWLPITWRRGRNAAADLTPPPAVLATVCLAVFAINLDTTIVNVALPSLSRQLGAGTSTLQWVVDGYSLAFAALVLTGGSLGDRFGRRPVLVTGLARLCGGIGALGGVVHHARRCWYSSGS